MKDEPKKQGFLLSNSKIKNSKILMDRKVKEMPVSICLNEKWEPPNTMFLTRKNQKEKFIYNYDFEIITNEKALDKDYKYIHKPCI
jgi:hypothetical protein